MSPNPADRAAGNRKQRGSAGISIGVRRLRQVCWL